MNKNILSFLLICLSTLLVHAQSTRYWVGSSIYRNSLTSSTDLLDWTLTNDNGTGSWTSSGTGSSLLKTDDGAGGYANQVKNTSSGSPRLLSLDENDGTVELQVVSLSYGSQFSIQVEEYTASNVYVQTTEILSWQSNTGFFTIYLGDYSGTYDALTTKIRFVILHQNIQAIQGTLELNYFNYFNTNNNWSNTLNWSATSGGTGNASLPGTLDQVIFDANSGTNAIIDQPVSIGNFALNASFKAGLVNAGNNSFSVSGTSLLNGGFMVGVNDHLYVHDVTVNGTQFVSTSGIITISGTLSYISGNFKPANGTMVFNSDYAQPIPGINFNNLTFTGLGLKTAAGSFSVAGNFVNNGAFSAAGTTILFNGTVGQTVSGTSTTVFNNVTISNSSSTGINLNAAVEMTGILNVQSGAKLFTNDTLTLVAISPTIFASIAVLSGTSPITGKIKYQKYIYSSQRIYRYLSSPMTTGTVADWQTSIPITGTFSNPSTGTGIVSTSPSMFVYNETVPGAKSLGYESYPATGVASSAASFVIGKGYSVYVRNNTGRPSVLEVKGIVTKGTQNLSALITYTSSGNIADDGWNLMGNPYPSSINWSSVSGTDRSNLDNAIYYQDNNSASPVYRSWVNNVGANCSSGIISPMQGFWVKANGGGTPVLRIRESHKTSTAPAFYRTSSDDITLLRIALDSTASSFHDETVIRLADEATHDFDSEFDAYKLYDDTHQAIGSSTASSPLLSINAFAPKIGVNDTIALFVKSVNHGTYTLSVPESTLDNSVTAYLWDTYTNNKTQLITGTTYRFDVSADSVLKTNRFKILLNDNRISTGIISSNSTVSGMSLFPNPIENHAVTIRFPKAAGSPIGVEVFDVVGARVYSEKSIGASNSEYSVLLPQSLTSGMYTIHVLTEDGVMSSTKCIIK
jgi:hypothetical protein